MKRPDAARTLGARLKQAATQRQGRNPQPRFVHTVPKLPPRPRAGHKGTFGTVLIVAGSAGMLGAAILCARGALRSGAGLVRVALPKALMAPCMVAVPAATTLPRSALAEAIAAASAIVIGPGLGVSIATRRLVRMVLRRARVPVVLDADALQVLAPLRRPLPGAAPKVLLPHPGEAGRLLGSKIGRAHV